MMRRIFACFCVLALAVLVMADAKAQDTSNCFTISNSFAYECANRTDAYTAVTQNGAAYASGGLCGTGASYSDVIFAGCSTGTNATCRADVKVFFPNGGGTCRQISRTWRVASECPAGQQWNEAQKKCDVPCSSKPPLGNVRFQVVGGSANTVCSGGCEFVVDLQGGTGPSGLTTIGGVLWYRAASMSPSGSSCSAGIQPIATDAAACATQGNLTQCVKPDGQHCATSSSGKQFCWQPGENGIKASGNDAATKSPDGTTPKPPPLPPNNGGEWTQTGQSTVSTTVSNPNNTTTTSSSTVTGWQSNYGSQGQGAGGNGASGEGRGGNGSGSGLGNGNGNGDGDDEGEDDGPGAPGAGVDDLYTPTDKTIAGVFAAFKARVGDAPMMDAIDSFFTVSASGSCPTWTVPASEYNDAMTLDWHCSGNVLTALIAIGWVIMALAAFFAAMWALS